MKTTKLWMLLGGVGAGLLLGKPAWSQTPKNAGTKERHEVRIKVIDDKDGQIRKIDTTFEVGADFNMKEWMKSMNIDLPEEHTEEEEVLILKQPADKLPLPPELMQIPSPVAPPELPPMPEHKIIVKDFNTAGGVPCEPSDRDCIMKWIESDSMIHALMKIDPENLADGEDVKMYHYKDGNGKTKMVVNKMVVRKTETQTESKETKALAAEIYPNPSSGIFTVEVYVPGKTASLEIKDKDGKVVYSEQVRSSGKRQIDLTSQGKGTYFLNLKQGKKTIQRQIMVN